MLLPAVEDELTRLLHTWSEPAETWCRIAVLQDQIAGAELRISEAQSREVRPIPGGRPEAYWAAERERWAAEWQRLTASLSQLRDEYNRLYQLLKEHAPGPWGQLPSFPPCGPGEAEALQFAERTRAVAGIVLGQLDADRRNRRARVASMIRESAAHSATRRALPPGVFGPGLLLGTAPLKLSPLAPPQSEPPPAETGAFASGCFRWAPGPDGMIDEIPMAQWRVLRRLQEAGERGATITELYKASKSKPRRGTRRPNPRRAVVAWVNKLDMLMHKSNAPFRVRLTTIGGEIAVLEDKRNGQKPAG